MLRGLAGSTATVTAGRGGSTIITQDGKPRKLVLPEINIIGRIVSPPPGSPPAATSALDKAKAWLDGISTGQKVMLLVGVLGLGYWGASRAGVIPGRNRRARNPRRRSMYVRNPRNKSIKTESSDPDIQKAIEFRKSFHWGYPAKYINPRRRIYSDPKVLVMLGRVKSITYQTNKKGEKARYFVHDFEKRNPELGMDIKNKRLHFVGGSYTVTDDGITG